jgi:hypothetical protein
MSPDNQQQNTVINQTSSTAVRVFEQIEREAITPISRFRFILSEWGVWVAWVATVVSGAIALATLGYVALSANYALYEATHDNFLTFAVAVMPYVWIVLFAGMVYLATYEMKNTKRGYRYTTSFIVGSSILGTVLGAMLLHSFGLGYLLDRTLGQQLSLYMSMEKMEQKMWQMPKEGRLIGELLASESLITSDVATNFKDGSGTVWRLNTTELRPRDLALLQLGERVRLLGTTTSEVTFHVCGVFPWMMREKAMSRHEMEEQRQEFNTVMREHKKLLEMNDDSLGRQNPHKVPESELCSHLAIMKRMR